MKTNVSMAVKRCVFVDLAVRVQSVKQRHLTKPDVIFPSLYTFSSQSQLTFFEKHGLDLFPRRCNFDKYLVRKAHFYHSYAPFEKLSPLL